MDDTSYEQVKTFKKNQITLIIGNNNAWRKRSNKGRIRSNKEVKHSIKGGKHQNQGYVR